MSITHENATAKQQVDIEDETRLLESIASGDKNAFDEFYSRFSGKVFGLTLKLVKDYAQAEEVTQEIFIEVWRTAPQYDPSRGRLNTWLMTITHRRSVDRIRSAQASINRDMKIGAREYAVDEQSPEEDVMTHMEAERVGKALKRLTDVQREAITLAYYEGYTQQQIAIKLQMPLSTIKTRLRDGMIRLRDELGVVK
jgi:RNA polymerase sigma-70 factor (ECF subfamily)